MPVLLLHVPRNLLGLQSSKFDNNPYDSPIIDSRPPRYFAGTVIDEQGEEMDHTDSVQPTIIITSSAAVEDHQKMMYNNTSKSSRTTTTKIASGIKIAIKNTVKEFHHQKQQQKARSPSPTKPLSSSIIVPPSHQVSRRTTIEPGDLAKLMMNNDKNGMTMIIDCRKISDYKSVHIRGAVNVCCNKLVRRRIQNNKMKVTDLLEQQLKASSECLMKNVCFTEFTVILYDQSQHHDQQKQSKCPKIVKSLSAGSKPTSTVGGEDGCPFVDFLLEKLSKCTQLARVAVLKGGFMDFHRQYPKLCEGAAEGGAGVSSRLSCSVPQSTSLRPEDRPEPPKPHSCNQTNGPTKILPFLYLGSQKDSLDQETLKKNGITHVLNLSVTCPKPSFISEENFRRIPVNDSYTEKLIPHFDAAFAFLDNVRENDGCALVHCLGGVSRSPTTAIAYTMQYLHMSQDEAYRYVKEKRPSISPNFNFLGQLMEYERTLQLKHGKEIKALQAKVGNQCVKKPNRTRINTLSKEIPSVKNVMLLEVDAEKASIKRSFSCPIKIQKLDESADLIAAEIISTNTHVGSPITELRRKIPTSNPKPSESSIIAIPSHQSAPSPRIHETSLMSPSVQMSRLSFDSDAAQSSLSNEQKPADDDEPMENYDDDESNNKSPSIEGGNFTDSCDHRRLSSSTGALPPHHHHQRRGLSIGFGHQSMRRFLASSTKNNNFAKFRKRAATGDQHSSSSKTIREREMTSKLGDFLQKVSLLSTAAAGNPIMAASIDDYYGYHFVDRMSLSSDQKQYQRSRSSMSYTSMEEHHSAGFYQGDSSSLPFMRPVAAGLKNGNVANNSHEVTNNSTSSTATKTECSMTSSSSNSSIGIAVI